MSEAAAAIVAETFGERPAPDLVEYPRSDLGNARRFVAMYRGAFLYAREERVWLEWRGGRWRRDVTGSVERAAKEVVEAMWRQVPSIETADRREELAKWAIASQSAARLRAMIELATSELDFVVTLDALDADPWVLSCGNGTLDLRTGELRQADPVDRISRGTDVHYNPRAPRERWDRFLREVFAGDEELIAFVKRAYGSCLTGDTRDRLLLIQYGSRFNGKSTLNRVFAQMLGEDLAQAAPIRLVMRGRTSEIPNEVARLHRARFVVVAETADGRKLNESQVKSLTGRDRIPARFLHKEWFEFIPEFKLVLYTNYKPRIDGSDGAVWDRVKLIPFNVSFADCEDKELDAKLEAELEGILAWAVEGCLEWHEDGLGTCDAVERATEGYRRENDIFGAFLRECCELGDEYSVLKTDLRDACEMYFREEGEEPPSAVAVGHALGAIGIGERKSGGRKHYRGVRLLSSEGLP
jgi:putative DNA primase/helicase